MSVSTHTYNHGCWVCADEAGIIGAEHAGRCSDHSEQIESECATLQHERDVAIRRAEAAEADAVRADVDSSGSGKVWYVEVDGVMIWSHAAIEGPPPDALDLWAALSSAVAERVQP